jgi:hypothetical protein
MVKKRGKSQNIKNQKPETRDQRPETINQKPGEKTHSWIVKKVVAG